MRVCVRVWNRENGVPYGAYVWLITPIAFAATVFVYAEVTFRLVAALQLYYAHTPLHFCIGCVCECVGVWVCCTYRYNDCPWTASEK